MKEIEIGKKISDLLEVGDKIEFINDSNKEELNILNDEMLKTIKEDIKNGLKVAKIDSNIGTLKISYIFKKG